MLYIVVLSVIKRIKFKLVMCRVLFHVRTKHFYKIPITIIVRKIKLSSIDRKIDFVPIF
jgi:hypothetical protein